MSSMTSDYLSGWEKFMVNVKWLFVLVVLSTISLEADAVEPAKNEGWTQKQFIITFWCPPPATDPVLAAVAAEHYNLTWVRVDGLDVAAKHKLSAMLTSEGEAKGSGLIVLVGPCATDTSVSKHPTCAVA